MSQVVPDSLGQSGTMIEVFALNDTASDRLDAFLKKGHPVTGPKTFPFLLSPITWENSCARWRAGDGVTSPIFERDYAGLHTLPLQGVK